MRIHAVLPMSVLLLAACETTPVDTAKNEEPARRRCDTVVTGSRIPQCDQTGARVLTREQIERDQVFQRGSPAAVKGE